MSRVLPVPPPTEPTVCPHCAGSVELLHHRRIYGRTYRKAWPWLFQCTSCKARVNTTRGANDISLALGSLATPEIRAARQRAHAAFDPIWKSRSMTRRAAYAWLARQLGLPVPHCHISWFNAEQCLQVIALSEAKRQRATA